MAYVVQIISLASVVTGTLIFSAMAVAALVNGRLKVEPNQPWLMFREHPIRFVAVVAMEAVFAVVCVVGSVRIASEMLR